VLDRYARELPGAAVVTGAEEDALWHEVREFTARFLAANPQGGVVAVSTSLMSMCEAIEGLNVPVIARAGSGVFYAHYATNPPPVELNGDSAMTAKVKNMFDPEGLLNPGRLYGFV
jgi:FAD/FMN-containing dehydrogenase